MTIVNPVYHVRAYRKDLHIYHLQMEYPTSVKNDDKTVSKVRELLENLDQKYPHLKFRTEYFESKPGPDSNICGLHVTISSTTPGYEMHSLEATVLVLHEITTLWQSGQIGPMAIHNDPSMLPAFETYLEVSNREKDVYNTLLSMVLAIADHNLQHALRHKETPQTDENGNMM